jgi:hypothetical protein
MIAYHQFAENKYKCIITNEEFPSDEELVMLITESQNTPLRISQFMVSRGYLLNTLITSCKIPKYRVPKIFRESFLNHKSTFVLEKPESTITYECGFIDDYTNLFFNSEVNFSERYNVVNIDLLKLDEVIDKNNKYTFDELQKIIKDREKELFPEYTEDQFEPEKCIFEHHSCDMFYENCEGNASYKCSDRILGYHKCEFDACRTCYEYIKSVCDYVLTQDFLIRDLIELVLEYSHDYKTSYRNHSFILGTEIINKFTTTWCDWICFFRHSNHDSWFVNCNPSSKLYGYVYYNAYYGGYNKVLCTVREFIANPLYYLNISHATNIER